MGDEIRDGERLPFDEFGPLVVKKLLPDKVMVRRPYRKRFYISYEDALALKRGTKGPKDIAMEDCNVR